MKAPVESYLRAGRDLDATDLKNRTLLLLAAAGGSADVCRLLLESGADPSRRDAEGNDALTIAINNGNENAAAVLRASLAPVAGAVGVNPDSVKVAEEDVPGLDQWEALTELPPPRDEPGLRAEAADLQQRISEHAPIDTAFDWSDVEIELPESATRHDPAHAFWLDEVRSLIHFGLSWGWVTVWQVASVAGDSGSRDDEDEIASRLRFVLGDIGISLEDDPALAPIVDALWPGDEAVVSHDVIVDEAVAFIDNLSRARDLHSYYMKDIQQMEAVVRRLGEVSH